MTAGEALDLADVAEILIVLLGRAIGRQTITDDELVAKMTARGAPPSFAKTSLGLYRASRAGEFAAVDPTLEHLLGRRTIAMRDLNRVISIEETCWTPGFRDALATTDRSPQGGRRPAGSSQGRR